MNSQEDIKRLQNLLSNLEYQDLISLCYDIPELFGIYRQLDARSRRVQVINAIVNQIEGKEMVSGLFADIHNRHNEVKSIYKAPSVVQISIAVIGIIIILALSCVTAITVIRSIPQPETNLSVHVVDHNGNAVANATVLLISQENHYNDITDSNGIVHFKINHSDEIEAKVTVSADQYEVHKDVIHLSSDTSLEVLLKPKPPPASANVLIKVIDSSTRNPIAGAQVSLFIDGNIYHRRTDFQGLAQFEFSELKDRINVEITASAESYETVFHQLTLIPGKLIEIVLKPNSAASETP